MKPCWRQRATSRGTSGLNRRNPWVCLRLPTSRPHRALKSICVRSETGPHRCGKSGHHTTPRCAPGRMQPDPSCQLAGGIHRITQFEPCMTAGFIPVRLHGFRRRRDCAVAVFRPGPYTIRPASRPAPSWPWPSGKPRQAGTASSVAGRHRLYPLCSQYFSRSSGDVKAIPDPGRCSL